MIYYSNTTINTKHMTFMGRWTPFHKGHTTLILTKIQQNPELPVLILVRATDYDQYAPMTRAEMIKQWMIENQIRGTVMIIPDVEGVYWGRGVGYKLEEVELPDSVTSISATNIRAGIAGNGKVDWAEDVASTNGALMAKPLTSAIIERGLVVWFTGCPSAGKTTIANALREKIASAHPFLKIQMLDGDVMRDTPIAAGLGFSPEDRKMHILRMGHLAQMFADHGILVIASFISPDKSVRDEVRESIGKDRFVEVFVNASKTVRIARDVKGLYKKAINGEIKNLTGYNAVYERPTNPAVVCDTHKEDLDESVNKVFEKVFVTG